jgi:anaerobic selenocysteine-containing dehydrogenase
VCALARRLGASHPGFEMTAWELIDATLQASGLPDAETAYRMRWVDCAGDFAEMHFLNGFAHPDRKFHFKADWAALGREHAPMSGLPDHLAVIDEATEEHPFRLVAAPSRSFLNSSFTETPSSRRREGRPTALIHPDDLAALGLAEGARVRLGNRRGSVVVHARPFDGVQRGVVIVESVWPNGAFEEGNGINTLTSADPGLPRGGAVFHDTAIWVRGA